MKRCTNPAQTSEALEHLRTTLQWVGDKLQGEMIEAPHYFKSHLSLGRNGISQGQLDDICIVVNDYLYAMGRSEVIVNGMGEIKMEKRTYR